MSVSCWMNGAARLNAEPVHLRINGRENPIGIDTAEPVFSWQTSTATANWMQNSYEIVVASTAAKLEAGVADVWDSGRIESSKSVGIEYRGPALQKGQRYFWSVRTWDTHESVTESKRGAFWEMGLLHPENWKAKWIRSNLNDESDALQRMQWIWVASSNSDSVPPGYQADFQFHLSLKELPRSVVVHILASGTYTTSVNGRETGHKQGWGAFDREDVSDVVHVGDNIVVVHFQTPLSTDQKVRTRQALAGAIQIVDRSGSLRWLVTDKVWQAQASPGAADGWQPAQVLGPFHDLQFGVGIDGYTPAQRPDRINSGTTLFRKEFHTDKPIESARLYITGLGSYQASINGTSVSDAYLAPGFTDYRKRVLYQTFDVTPLLKQGANAIGVVLAAGWHGSPLLISGTRFFPGPELLRAQLELHYKDKSIETISTDRSWLSAPSPTTSSELYAGESYDARLFDPGWNRPARSPHSWKASIPETIDPQIIVTSQPDEMVQVQQKVNPISVKAVHKGAVRVAVFDMGQNMAGVVRLRVRGKRGAIVRLRFAERLNPDGSVYTENLRNADATDTYTLSGRGQEEWTPRFTYHGFRYVEISGYPGMPPLSAIRGEVLSSLPSHPSFTLQTSNSLLNSMAHLGLWGQRGNFVSIPTDCPQRDERLGWMGDAGVFWRTGSYNFDIDAFSHKFMQDVVDAQHADGSFSDVSPNVLGKNPGAPGWEDAGIIIPYWTWQQYGDTTILRKNWAAMQRLMESIAVANPNYLRTKQLGNNYADWLAPDNRTPPELVATAYWAIIALQMERMAAALGSMEESKQYGELYSRIRRAYQQAYVKPGGRVEGDTQAAYVLTLHAGLAPGKSESEMTRRLVENIRQHQNHLTTGFLSTPFLLPVLARMKRTDIAYELLLSRTYPSWGYMIDKGATTWWERWNGDTGDPAMNSYNHYSFGSVMAWVYSDVVGIEADPDDPGYQHILIHPALASAIKDVHGAFDSPYGRIVSEWAVHDDGTYKVFVEVPPNTVAKVRLPQSTVLKQNGVEIHGQPIGTEVQIEVGSGITTFEGSPVKPLSSNVLIGVNKAVHLH